MKSQEFQDIDYSIEHQTAQIVMNRPSVLNALSQRMFRDLARAFRQARLDESVNFVSLTGAGRAFSAGLDIVQVAGLKKRMDARRFVFRLVKPFWDNFLHCDKPIVSLVNGPAYGAGAEIALFSDFVIASENAVFAFSGGRVGALCCISGILGQLTLNGRRVAEMNMTGHSLTAQEAVKEGMVNYVVSEGSLRDKFATLRDEIMRVSPDSNASFKRIQRSLVPKYAYARAYNELFRTLTTDNFIRGVDAFVAKKPPQYFPRTRT